MPDALANDMHLISHQTPAPRLLSTVVPELREKPPERISMRSRLKTVSLFSGNGRAIFLGIVLGGALIWPAGIFYVRHQAARRHAEEARRLLAISIAQSQPTLIRISADMIHVTAISLGQPRLAIINGQQRSEGEQVTIYSPAAGAAVTVQVAKISDGRIDLSDGLQTLSARLEMPPIVRPKS